MRKLIIIWLCIVGSAIYSQQLKLGGTVNFSVSGSSIDFLFGQGMRLEYDFQSLPISVGGNTNFYIGEVKGSFRRAALGASMHYFPIRAFMEPYLGAGFSYNFNNRETGNGYPILKETENNLTVELLFGVNLTPKDKICIINEISYEVNQPRYSTYHYENNEQVTTRQKLDLNTLLWKFGLMVKL